MVVKMKFLNIMGPRADLDRVVEKYISKFELQLENSILELDDVKGLRSFNEPNPYEAMYTRISELANIVSADKENRKELTKDDAFQAVDELEHLLSDFKEEKENLIKTQENIKMLLEQIAPYQSLSFDIQTLFKFEFIRFRFGRMPKENYKQFEEYITNNTDVLFINSYANAAYVWGVYFVPESLKEKADAIFSSLHFERLRLSDELEGTPNDVRIALTLRAEETTQKLSALRQQKEQALASKKELISAAYTTIKRLYDYFDIRKFAAYTKDNFYIITGWMTEQDTAKFSKAIEDDNDVICVVENDNATINSKPPTKLKNFFLFRPFEMFIQMYGLPGYKELDPTLFVALTYAILFGMMFGDVGQGALLVVIGFILYRVKKIDLAAIISFSGLFSILFGFMYGSIFGYEEAIPTLWLKPMEEITTALFVSVLFGVGLIISAMIFNIINGIKAGDKGRIFFDTNGISGLIFYCSVLAAIILSMNNQYKIAGWVLGIFIGLPIILVGLKEPLSRLVAGKKKILPKNKGMFFLEAFFELFEILLSYITNTISFVRVGAFALSHAGMMGVVHMLAKSATDSPNILMLILGNLIIILLEGLIVGIQVLRLEYYEMFSRFFRGGGRPFEPYPKRPKK